MSHYKLIVAILVLVSLSLMITAYQYSTTHRIVTSDSSDDAARLELRATDTGVDAVDNMNRQEAIEKTLERTADKIRTITTDKRGELAGTVQSINNKIDRRLSQLESRALSLSSEARLEWTHAKTAVLDAKNEFLSEYKSLENRVQSGWREARISASDALDNLAVKIKHAESVVTPGQRES